MRKIIGVTSLYILFFKKNDEKQRDKVAEFVDCFTVFVIFHVTLSIRWQCSNVELLLNENEYFNKIIKMLPLLLNDLQEKPYCHRYIQVDFHPNWKIQMCHDEKKTVFILWFVYEINFFYGFALFSRFVSLVYYVCKWMRGKARKKRKNSIKIHSHA